MSMAAIGNLSIRALIVADCVVIPTLFRGYLEDIQLASQEQDFEVLLSIGLAHQSDALNDDRNELHDHEPQHGNAPNRPLSAPIVSSHLCAFFQTGWNFLGARYEFTHEAVREWEERFAPLLSGQLKAKRRGQAGKSWYVDETYIKINGRWHYLYRAIDREGNLVDTMLSPTRDLGAAKAFFKQAIETVGHKPERVMTDGHGAYPQAIRRALGRKTVHRTSQYLNNEPCPVGFLQ
jgi:DDE superfamily endonuclease